MRGLTLVGSLLLCGLVHSGEDKDNVPSSPPPSMYEWQLGPPIMPPVTPLPGGDVYYNGIEAAVDWQRRIILTFYFDKICPCNWGVMKDNCVYDDRYPDWWPESKRRPIPHDQEGRGDHLSGIDSDSDSDIDLEDAESWGEDPLLLLTSPSGTSGLQIKTSTTTNTTKEAKEQFDPELLRCYQGLFTGIGVGFDHSLIPDIIVGTPSIVEKSSSLQMIGQYHVSAKGSTGGAIQFTNSNFPLGYLTLTAWNYLENGFKWTEDADEPKHTIQITTPSAWDNVWWPMTYNYKEAGVAFVNRVSLVVNEDHISIARGVDALLWYETLNHVVKGEVSASFPIRSGADNTYSLKFHLSVSSSDTVVGRYSTDDIDRNNPGPQEYLCGPPTKPPLCRTHLDVIKVHNQIYGTFTAHVGAIVNRTWYEWDTNLEHEDPHWTNWELRHQCKILEVKRLVLNEDFYANDVTRYTEIEDLPEGFQENIDPQFMDWNQIPDHVKLRLSSDQIRATYKLY